MAHHVEPIDIDSSVCDFDNKENSFRHNNVLPRTPCTEKGYEELDVSELNMKLRYSITPASSPMSKSYTANCLDNKSCEPDSTFHCKNDNMSQSLHSTLTNNESINPQKVLPLQVLSTDQGQVVDANRNTLRPLVSTVTLDNNVTVTLSNPNDIDDNLSLPSSSSSLAHTPEATTPTKEMSKGDGASPIMRGLKSVLNMFRPSQSPIPPDDETKQDVLSPPIVNSPDTSDKCQVVSASTPLFGQKSKDTLLKVNTNRDSLVFNEDLQKELEWKDETTILFNKEKIPIHKLFFQQSKPFESNTLKTPHKTADNDDKFDTTVEYMDISYNDSELLEKTLSKIPSDLNKSEVTESDSEFVDCESSFAKNESLLEKTFELPIGKYTVEKEYLDTAVSEIIGFTESQHPNASNETLNASNSADLTAVSTETTTATIYLEANDNNVGQQLIKESLLQRGEVYADKIDDENVTNVIEINTDDNVKLMTVQNDATITNNVNVNMTPIPENVVNTITQIPLIVDPRVLLLNIPSGPEIEKNNGTFDVSNVSPTDMPLPDDGEIDNMLTLLPVNPLVDNSVQTLNTVIEDENQTNVEKGKLESDENDDSTQMLGKLLALNVSLANTASIPENFKTLVNNLNTSIAATVTENDILQSIDNLINEFDGNKAESELEESVKSQNIDQLDTNILEPKLLNDDPKPVIEGEINNKTLNLTVEAISNEMISEKAAEAEDVAVPDFIIQASHEMSKNIVKNGVEVLPPAVHVSKYETKIPLNSEDMIESEMAKEIACDLESIKQEVEAIVATAINIVADKVADSESQIPDFEWNGEANIPVVNTTQEVKSVEAVIAPDNIKEMSNTLEKNHSFISEKGSVDCTDEIHNETSSVIEKTKVDQFLESTLKDINTANNATEEVEVNILPIDINVCTLGKEEVNVNDSQVNNTELRDEKLGDKMEDELLIIKNKANLIVSSLTDVCNTSTSKTQEIQDTVSHNSNLPIKDYNTATLETPKSIQTVIAIAEKVQNKTENLNNLDEEIITSGNTSPFVSVSAEIEPAVEVKTDNFEEIDNPQSYISPPLSPKIVSKGYNLNFDDIEDPFATKTKVRVSPPPGGSPNLSFENTEVEKELPKREINKNNRRKSQTERRKPVDTNRKFNSTFSAKSKVTKETPVKPKILALAAEDEKIKTVELDQGNCDYKDASIPVASTDETMIIDKGHEPEGDPELIEFKSLDTTQLLTAYVNKDINLPTELNENKDTSSSEQSTYYSAEAPSNEGLTPRNAFNLPEIDDPNFNPFASKSKMRQSPPPNMDYNKFASNTKIAEYVQSDDSFAPKNIINSDESSIVVDQNVDIQAVDSTVTVDTLHHNATIVDNCINATIVPSEEKDSSHNTSNVTVKTEDADTLEGPFLETEDLCNDDKISDFDGDNVDVMQFSELPPGTDHGEAGEIFIDAEAFEFLLNQNQANTIADSGKESLFLKFDPLFAKRVSSDGVLAALNKVQKRESTPKKVEKSQIDVTFEKSIAGPSTMTMDATHDIDISNTTDDSCGDLNVTVSKPMMVVNPAVNPAVTPRNKSTTPVRSNRQSLTFTSPAIAVIDRLLCMSTAHRDNEADLALTQLRELLADKEISVYNLRSESKVLKDRLSNLESQMKSLEAISEERLKKINELNEKLTEKSKINKSMGKVVEEYERTIASLISEMEEDKKRHAEKRIQLTKERDEQTAHLASMEVSFSDLYSKYEKSKQVIMGFKANEDTYKKSLKDFDDNFTKMQNNYDLLKQHATTKLNHANEELQKINRLHESEVLKLNAMIKRKDLHITSLEESLQQKIKENDELTSICDELINRVG